VLATPVAGFIKEKEFRKYTSYLRTTTMIGGSSESAMKTITYEVGRHKASIGLALSRASASSMCIEGAYPTAATLNDDFVGLAKKYSNFSGFFEYTNLIGVVERISKGLAASSLYPGVSSEHLRGGSELSIHVLGVHDAPVSAHNTAVFIPRLTDRIIAPDVFAVLASAVAGEGSAVATDMLNTDATTHKPIMRDVAGPAFSKACVDALRILGSNFAASNAGDLFALGVTRGIHNVVTTVGHTDEGGYMRSVFRACNFSAPFGGIHWMLKEYVGLPALSSTNQAEIAGYVDSLALMTAGLVAHCDPGIVLNGEWFPTVFHASGSAEFGSGIHTSGSDSYVDANKASLDVVVQDFAGIYVPALSKLFGLFGGSGLAEKILATTAQFVPDDDRHLKYASIAPFFWVEPTSLINHDFVGSSAETEGFASYATKNRERTLNAFEYIEEYGTGSLVKSSYRAKFRGARATPFFAHWHGHKRNGLASIIPMELDPDSIIHPGRDTAAPAITARFNDGADISRYLWVRGQSKLPAPSEFLNISGTIGFTVTHCSVTNEGDLVPEHVPMSNEFASTNITFMTSIPQGTPLGPLGYETTNVARGRTRATRELLAAQLRCRTFGSSTTYGMVRTATAPVLMRRPPLPVKEAHLPMETGSVSNIRAGVVSSPETRVGKMADTVPLNTTFQESAFRAPQPGVIRHVAAASRSTAHSSTFGQAPSTGDSDSAVPLPPTGPAGTEPNPTAGAGSV
jgi:hypothetical protein